MSYSERILYQIYKEISYNLRLKTGVSTKRVLLPARSTPTIALLPIPRRIILFNKIGHCGFVARFNIWILVIPNTNYSAVSANIVPETVLNAFLYLSM